MVMVVLVLQLLQLINFVQCGYCKNAYIIAKTTDMAGILSTFKLDYLLPHTCKLIVHLPNVYFRAIHLFFLIIMTGLLLNCCC